MPIKAILFDWGNTVMRSFPQYHGPMMGWPILEVMPGIAETLPILTGDYNLCLATNAADSSIKEIRSALARVHLNPFFQQVFTAGGLGSAKPQKKFFARILDQLGLEASEVIMVGDDLHADIAGAFNAGIRSIWINENPLVSTRSHPFQMVELLTAGSLPDRVRELAQNTLPGLDECISLLHQYPSTPDLQKHIRAVALAAYFTAQLLVQNGQSVNPILAHRGGLLHDLDKLESLKTGLPHGQAARQILSSLGYAQLGRIALSHPAFSLLDPSIAPITLEEKIVYIADKMVEGGDVVTVPQRLASLISRYPKDVKQFDLLLPQLLQLESEILTYARITRESLQSYLNRKVSLIP